MFFLCSVGNGQPAIDGGPAKTINSGRSVASKSYCIPEGLFLTVAVLRALDAANRVDV